MRRSSERQWVGVLTCRRARAWRRRSCVAERLPARAAASSRRKTAWRRGGGQEIVVSFENTTGHTDKAGRSMAMAHSLLQPLPLSSPPPTYF